VRIEASVGEIRGWATLAGRSEVQIVLTSRADDNLTITDEIRLASGAARQDMADRFAPPICDDALAVLERLALEMAKVDRPAPVQTVTLSDVEVEHVQWLWPARIAYGKLAVLEGQPGVGKSQLTMALAAAVSRGRAMPGGETSEPANVLLLTAEDDPADTVLPRLMAAGGDPDRVHMLQGVADEDGGYRFPGLPGDVLSLAAEIKRLGAKLVVVDPLTAYLGGEVNSWRDSDIRRALAPLAAIAQATGAAIVLVRHLTKAPTGQAITAGGGSIAIVGAARTALLVANDPDDPERRVLACVKNNLARMPESLSFRLAEQPSGWSAVRWDGHSTFTADDLIAAGRDTEERTQRDEAKDFLQDILAAGPVASEEVIQQSKKLGHSKRTFDRARAELKVESYRDGTRWYLRLPDTAKVANNATESGPSLYSAQGGNLEVNSPPSDDIVKTSKIATPWQPSVATLNQAQPAERPPCSLCGGPLVKRRSGVTRCPKCTGHTARDPYIEPLPNGGAAA
jgi:hypothetical protein